MMSMTIGAYSTSGSFFASLCFISSSLLAFALGLGLRFGLHTNPRAKNLYIIEYMFVVLSVSLTILFRPCIY